MQRSDQSNRGFASLKILTLTNTHAKYYRSQRSVIDIRCLALFLPNANCLASGCRHADSRHTNQNLSMEKARLFRFQTLNLLDYVLYVVGHHSTPKQFEFAIIIDQICHRQEKPPPNECWTKAHEVPGMGYQIKL